MLHRLSPSPASCRSSYPRRSRSFKEMASRRFCTETALSFGNWTKQADTRFVSYPALIAIGTGLIAFSQWGVSAQNGQLRGELKGEMGQLRGEMGQLKAELRGEMGQLKAELKAEMGQLRAELKGELAEMRADSTLMKRDIADTKRDIADILKILNARQ
ncbi:hypothetical protein V8C86DRAFT_2885711 [Haematococcus lacustris]